MMRKTTTPPIPSAAYAIALTAMAFLSTGCLAKRGIDFGHWSRTPERIEAVRVFRTERDVNLAVGERLLVLMPVGKPAPPEARRMLQDNIVREIQQVTTLHPFCLDPAVYARYGREDNIADAGGQFDLGEIVRLGALSEATYVLCVHINAWRPYPPQILAMRMMLVDVVAGERVAELNGSFYAEEQQVVVAMDDWLQSRRARKYDAQNLDILLRSPSEYSAFVTARCIRSLFDALKNTSGSTDKKGNRP